MPTTFVVEDGSVVSGANALISVADADQITENYGNPLSWSSAITSEKENAIRQATRYLNFHYVWDGWKVDADQTCQHPRYKMYDEEGNIIDNDIVHEQVKEACAYLAVKVMDGDTLLEDFDNESKVKKTKDVVGPITEEREYSHEGESPEKTYQVVDILVAPFIIEGSIYGTEVLRG